MIPTTSLILLITFLIINSGLLYYFFNKYQETKLNTTLYWVTTYMFFVVAILISIIIGLGDVTLQEAITIQVPFVLLGLTTLGMSAISTGIFVEDSQKLEIGFGVVGFLGAVFFFTGLDTITTIIFILIAFFAVIAYFYLAYSGNNYRVAIISLGLLLQAISGRLSVSEIITDNTQLILNSIGQIAIAVGLLGIGLRDES